MRPRTLTHDFAGGWLPRRDTGLLHLKGDRIMTKTASDRMTSARKAKPGDLLITIDCRRCADSDDEVYDVLDGPTRSNTAD